MTSGSHALRRDHDLFTLTPATDTPMANYRKDGPETSRDAAIGVEEMGVASTYRALLLRAVSANPGRTCGELAVLVSLPRQEASKRLPELRELRLVRNGAKRACSVQGTRQMTWWAAADFPADADG